MIHPDSLMAFGDGTEMLEKNDYDEFSVVGLRNRSSGSMHFLFTMVVMILIILKLPNNDSSMKNRVAYCISRVGEVVFIVGFCAPSLLSALFSVLHITFYSKLISRVRAYVESFGQCCAIFSLGLLLISSGVDGKCSNSSRFWERIPCNSSAASTRLSMDLILIVLLSPILFSVVFGTLSRKVLSISWFLSFISLVISVSISHSENLVIFPIYSIVLGWLVYENRKFVYCMFKDNQQYYEARLSLQSTSRADKKVLQQMHILKQLIGNVIHDLLTPMQALEIGVDTLQSMFVAIGTQSVDADFWDLLHSMKGTLSLMSMVIHRCMDVAQCSDGSVLVAHYEIFEFTTVVSRVGQVMADMQSRIQLDVRFMRGIHSTQVHTDKRWFEDNMLCMLSNAVKYSRNITGVNVQLKVFTSNSFDSSGNLRKMLTVEVWDSGVAMSEEVRSRLFNMPDMDDRKEMGGAGLGLFSMACRVSALGGVLGSRDRDDELCEGSVFWFSIPCDSRILDKNQLNMENSNSFSLSGNSSLHSSPYLNQSSSSEYMSFHQPTNLTGELHLEAPIDESVQGIAGKDEETEHGYAIVVDGINAGSDAEASSSFASLDRPSRNNSLALGPPPRTQIPFESIRGSFPKPISQYSPMPGLRRSFLASSRSDEESSPSARLGSFSNSSINSSKHDKGAAAIRIVRRSKSSSTSFNASSHHVATGGRTQGSSVTNIAPQQQEGMSFVQEISRNSFSRRELPSLQRELRSLSILAVDDSITIMKILKMSWGKDGHKVDPALNGQDGLTMMLQKEYDVVLMDIMLPGMNGCEVVKLFRKYESYCRSGRLPSMESDSSDPSASNPILNVPNRLLSRSRRQLIVCMSANFDARSKMEALLSGMDAFLAKPFSRQAFMDILSEKLSPINSIHSIHHNREYSRDDLSVLTRIAETAVEGSMTGPCFSPPPSPVTSSHHPAHFSGAHAVDRDESRPLLNVEMRTGEAPAAGQTSSSLFDPGAAAFTVAAAGGSDHAGSAVKKGSDHAGSAVKKGSDHAGSAVKKGSDQGMSTQDVPTGQGSQSNVRVQNDAGEKRRLSVLVVEDSRPILRVVVMNLVNKGHHVEQAVNGEEALKLMKERAYDIVVMDLQMPVMGACEAVPLFRVYETELIAKGQRSTRQFIAATSAHHAEESRQQALASGMDAFLQKPFRTAALLACWRDQNHNLGISIEGSSSGSSGSDHKSPAVSQGVGQATDQTVKSEENREPKSQLTVLIVEDSISIMKALTMNLRRGGHVVDQAGNGVFGLQAMQTKAYDIVLMDLQMPEMGGLEATKMFRLFEATTGQSSGRDMRQVILGMSAHIDSDVEVAAKEAGMDAFMAKPFKIEEMLTLARAKLAENMRLTQKRDI